MTDALSEGLGLSVTWLCDAQRVEEITSLFLEGIHNAYISHGELMDGRADAPGLWSPDIAEIHRREMARLDLSGGPFLHPGVRVAVAEREGQIVGFATVTRDRDEGDNQDPVPFATIEDFIVAENQRGLGVGSQLISWVEKSLNSVGIARIFLESGVANEDAHRFFRAKGYAVTSVTFMKDLGSHHSSL
ncbi:acetyltransferase [Pontimonas salivibrio]|uniref:Acetyltransferase n=1 Tax=Pontimonas salivibrio TaxID=1159327 RepID=A0A2L2BNJ9_9MICO|nr:acetyltransferase [Pontimonas salivibrio]